MTTLKDLKSSLSPLMQERLDKWRNQTEKPKMVKTCMGNYIQHRDFGDDIADWEHKEREKNREHYINERNRYGR